MKMSRKHVVIAICGALLIWLILPNPGRRVSSAPTVAPTLPLLPSDPAPVYSTRGRGKLTVEGDGCCDGVVFPGTFEMDYEMDESTRGVRITRLDTTLADMDIAFHFLIFEMGRVRMRCGTARSESPIDGSVDAAGNLIVATGAATLSGASFDRRDDSGECAGGVSAISLSNNAPLTGRLDPLSNNLFFNSSFTTVTEGHTYTVHLEMTGEYVNRPPVALMGVEGPGLEAFAQGGCPAVMNGGNPAEPTVEANDPGGLKMYARSFSSDADGTWRGADIRFDQWFHSRDSEPIKFIGESRWLGPLLFEFGPMHHLKLETTDRAGDVSNSICDFRVVDRTPPAVIPPGDSEVGSSVYGGATPSTSDALRAFLNSASAKDIVDTKPTALPPLLNGKTVNDGTFFPAGTWLSVTFRFLDKFGNVGSSVSLVRVNPPKK